MLLRYVRNAEVILRYTRDNLKVSPLRLSHGRTGVLLYESFSSNLTHAVVRLEQLTGCAVSACLQGSLLKDLDVHRVKETLAHSLTKKEAAKTMLHSHHISIFQGNTDYRALLTSECLRGLKAKFFVPGPHTPHGHLELSWLVNTFYPTTFPE